MVSRSRKRRGTLLGQRAGNQAANTTRDLRTFVYVVPAVSNVQYRLTEENGITRLKFTHRAMGQISHDVQIERGWAQIETGWDNLVARIRSAAQKYSH
jgi:hypothetical protein